MERGFKVAPIYFIEMVQENGEGHADSVGVNQFLKKEEAKSIYWPRVMVYEV